MLLTNLRMCGFLSYTQPVEVDFGKVTLACISGPNGAGKSSLLDAITWALFGQARRKDDALINDQSKQAEVILDFEYENNLYRIQRIKERDKATQLYFFIMKEDHSWNVLGERALRDTEKMIEKVLHMDYDTFINASFFLQGKADQFAQQTPGARKGILSTILGLEVWEGYRERAADMRREQEQNLKSHDDLLDEISKELAEEDQRKKDLQQVEEKLAAFISLRQARYETLKQVQRRVDTIANQERLVAVARKNAIESSENRDKQKRFLADRMAELAVYQEQIQEASSIEAAYKQWQTICLTLADMEKTATSFRQITAERQPHLVAIESERARLLQEKRSLLDEKNQLERELALKVNLEAQVNQAEADERLLKEELDQRELIEDNLQQLQGKKADLSAVNKCLRTEMDELRERIDQLSETEGANCPLCGQELSEADRVGLINSLNAQGKQKAALFRSNQEFLSQADGLISSRQLELNSLRQKDMQLKAKQREIDQGKIRIQAIDKLEAGWVAGGLIRLAEVEKTLADDSFAPESRKVLSDIDEKLKNLGYDAVAHDALKSLESEKRSSQEAMAQLQAARAAIQPLEKTIRALEPQVKELEAQAQQREQEFVAAEEKLKAEVADLPNLADSEEAYRQAQEEENRLRRDLGGARQKVEVLDQRRKRQQVLVEERKSIATNIAQLRILERSFGKEGVPALLIEQALPEIENQANEILGRLTSGIMNVQFITQKNLKSKKDEMKETLDIVISDSYGSRPYEMFSGGEAFRVNFAIRLALSRVLAQRAGARLQTLVIDEGFGSQDSEGRQRLIEAINYVRDDFGKILVITHLEDLKDAFPARIEVEKTSSGSDIHIWA